MQLPEINDLVNVMEQANIPISMPTVLWKTIDGSVLQLVQNTKWKTFKYFDNVGKISTEITKVSDVHGGIYCFYISPEIIPEKQRILMYIGRAQITEHQNLRKRISEYVNYSPPNYERPKVARMLRDWKDYLYCSYIELNDNSLIVDVEAELINKLLPWCNDQIPNQTISRARRAAGL